MREQVICEFHRLRRSICSTFALLYLNPRRKRRFTTAIAALVINLTPLVEYGNPTKAPRAYHASSGLNIQTDTNAQVVSLS